MNFRKPGNQLIAFVLLSLIGLTSCKTLQKPPKSVIEQSMLRALAWQEANPFSERPNTDWTWGAYYVGIVRAHQTTKQEPYKNALIDVAAKNNWQPGRRFYHADDATILYSYLYLNSLNAPNVNLQPANAFIADHLYKPYPWRDGTDTTSSYRKILWWWCDALFMAPPVLTVLAKQENNEKYLDEMHKYYMETYNLLYDKSEKLFARDMNYLWTGSEKDRKEKNGKKIFWSRGNGWVLGGLALILEDMPKGYEHRKFYETLFVEMAGRVKELQPEDGLWRPSLLSPESYNHGEASGSGFFTFALAWGINNGLLNKEEFKPAVLKGWSALMSCQQSNGKIGWVQSIGAAPGAAQADSWQVYGTGAYLLAGSEILKLK